MMPFAQWLERGTKKKTRKPMRKVSKKRVQVNREYSVRRKAFLEAHPRCQRCDSFRSQDVHHKKGRLGGNLLDQGTWVALCRSCHDWIHAHPKYSRSIGLLQ
jgi:4-alpha-glucanotransferase